MTSNLGTTAWCAPELLTATNKTRYSVKVDVYSFGMVLWELWERKRPYEELYSRFDIIDAVREGRRPAISSTCPPTFRSLIQRCWHEQPARRPTFAYIVRYIKDELAHIKRQRMSSATSFSPLHHLLMGPRSKSGASGTTISSPDLPSHSEDTSPSVSVEEDSSKVWLQQRGGIGGAVAEHVQPDAPPSASSILHQPACKPPPSTLPTAPLAIPQKPSQESLDMLASSPWADGSGGDPEEPSVAAPPSRTAPLVGARNAWRDKYVMRFNGWKSSEPDTGLPPSVYSSGGGQRSPPRAEKTESAVSAPVRGGGRGDDSFESTSQGSSRDSSSDDIVLMTHSTLPAQGAYELDLYSSTSSVSPEDLPRLPAARATEGSARDSATSGRSTQHRFEEEQGGQRGSSS